MRNRGCLECEEASVLLASYPKEEAAEAQSLGETASTSIGVLFGPRFAQWNLRKPTSTVSFTSSVSSNCQRAVFSKQTHYSGERPFRLFFSFNGQVRQERAATKPPSRSHRRCARNAARTSSWTLGGTRQAPASFHRSSREAGKDLVQPHAGIRPISVHHVPVNKP